MIRNFSVVGRSCGQHNRGMEYGSLMGKLYAAMILFCNACDALQADSSMMRFCGEIRSFVLVYTSVKTIVHGNGEHFSGTDDVQGNEAVMVFGVICRFYGVFQKISKKDCNIKVRNHKAVRDVDAGSKGNPLIKSQGLIMTYNHVCHDMAAKLCYFISAQDLYIVLKIVAGFFCFSGI